MGDGLKVELGRYGRLPLLALTRRSSPFMHALAYRLRRAITSCGRIEGTVGQRMSSGSEVFGNPGFWSGDGRSAVIHGDANSMLPGQEEIPEDLRRASPT